MKRLLWIDERDALAVHDRLLLVHGGAPGVGSRTLLQSALARPRQHYAYGSADLIDLAAIYTSSLIRNHPFVDGNRRTGFVLGVLFLEINGMSFQATEEDAAQGVLALAARELQESEYGAFLRANSRKKKERSKSG